MSWQQLLIYGGAVALLVIVMEFIRKGREVIRALYPEEAHRPDLLEAERWRRVHESADLRELSERHGRRVG